uniref:Mediator of RNA polymerase II transcription subunit 13 n=1 Tax=Meloidogyne javanica TaxID=6303 RepID=A0A915MGN6_MELJA
LKSSTLCADIVGTDNADPVLRAYIDCLEANLLCTWRRRPPVASTLAAFGNPIPRPDAQKELWIFWYTSEEPKLVEDFKLRGLNVVTHSEATDADAPRVEFEYETRTLFFKSLNSAIERRLLSEGFVRFGRWLCRPLELSSLYAEDKHTIPKFMNAIRFHYFLHRDSLVCASIVVQRQPAILRLSQCHFKEATQSAQPVILAPWSIRAQLLPNQQDFVGDFDTRKTPVIPSPSNEEGPSFLSSTLSPEKNDGGGTCPKRRLSQLVESHWKEWKRIYPALELLTTNSNGNKSSNAANNKRRTSSGVISSSRSNSLSSIPRMVVIQLGGQFVLYPSAFVGILVDELICPLPFKTTTSTSKTDEATCSDILVDNILDQSEKSSKSFSSRKSDFQTSKIRRHIHTGLSAARASYGLGCLRNPKNRVSAAEHSDPFNCDLQQQRASDCMAEFGYDYMRREFCYCRICPQLGRAFSSVQSSLAESQKESQTCQTTLNSLISNNHHQQPKVSFHRMVSDEGIQSNGDDYLNESNVFSNDPYSLLPMLNPEVNHSNSEQLSQLQPYAAHQSFVSSRQPQSMLMKLLLSPSAEGMDAQQRDGCLTEAQTHDMSHNQHQNSVMATIRTTNITEGLTTLSQQQIATTNHIIDEHMDEYAVTPPALLDSDTSLLVAQQQQMADQEIKDQQGLMMNISLHEMNFGEEVHACGHSSPDLYSPPSTTCNTLQTLLQHQQQHTPQNTMLSPPASNEQVDSVNSGGIPASQIFHGGIPTTSNFTTTCMNQPTAIVSVLGYFAEQLHNLPWEEPIYELSNHHKSHARHFCKNMLSVGENNLDDRLNDVSCAECSSILNALENQNQHNRLLKRDCCHSESVEKITPNFILKMPTGVGTLTAIQLHALAQRRTKADSQLEYRLQLEEHARFRILVGNNSSEFVPQWPGGNWHDNLPQVPPFPHIPSLHPQGIRNFGPSFPIFQGSVQPILSHNEQLVDGNSPVTPFYHQSVAETPQQQMDTIADLHYDIVFDACPLCCCNSNIRSFELGFYITGPKEMLKFCDYLQQRQRQQQPQALLSKHWSGFRIPPVELQKCICGFSAVRHRYLCGQGSGLFQEDIAEALGVIYAPSQRLLLRNFNTNDLSDCKLMDLIRHLVISRDVASLVEGRLSLLYSTSPEYLQSSVDSFELNALINGIMGVCGILQERQKYPVDESFLHPWGYQSANSVGEPRDTECLGIFDEVCDIMRDPSFPSLVPCFSSNGRRFDQLSLRIFARIKNVSLMGGSNRIGEEENGRAEPIPKVVVLSSAEREPLLLSPTMIRNWEQLELMPIDQPKDVLYLALVPDVNVLAEKCKIFLEELGSVYERRCRLGSHIRLSIKDAPKDAILRVGRSSLPLNLGYQMFNSLPHSFFTQFGFDQHLSDPIIQKFASYMECCNQELQELAKFLTANDSIFERRALLESIFRQQHIPLTTSLASPPDASAMPPPAMPGGTLFTSNGQSANVSAENGVNSLAIHQHPSPLSTPGFANQQQSPAGGSGPNSVPILHGNVSGDCLNATAAMSRTPSGIESVEELAKMEDKLIKDMREQVDLLLSKEEQARRLQMPHVLVIYLINPFGQIAVTEQQQKHKLVNVFEMSTEFSERFEALATAAFLRAWNNFLSLLNFNRRSQLQLELLPLRKVYDYCAFMGMSLNDQQCNAGSRISAWDELRRLSFSIYTQPRLVHLNIAQEVLSKSMTKFGTAEKIKDIFLTFGDNMFLLKQNCSPFLLAPERNIHFLSHGSSNPSTTSGSGNTGGSFGSQHSGGHKLQLLSPDERILFLAYCLIADGKWLCASVTDERGSLLDTTLINLNVPSEDTLPPLEQQKEWKHKERHSQIADALQRLWLFVRSVMLGQEVHQWRLVINRMGKLGHTEFKIWNDLLSKRSLKAYNSSLKNNQSNSDGLSASTSFLNNCLSCSNSHGSHETPAILSACLVSTEGEPHLRVFGSPCASANSLDTQSPGNVGVSNTNSNTSNVIGSSSTSNIGNSASTKTGGSKGAGRHSLLQAQQWAAVQQQLQASPDDRSLTHIIVFPTILNVSCQQQEDIMHGGIDDDVFADFLGNCFGGEGAPDGMELVEDLVFDEGPRNEEEAPIDNQPMAIGYTITTAPVWPLSAIGSSLSLDCGLSDAFWYNCPPAARHRRLTHLKSSLHINSTNLLQTDDYQQTTGKNVGTSGNQQSGNATTGTDKLAPNPLDLPNTDDILRYVLERQNALSWLNLDPVSGSRYSCLPIHMQAIHRLAESIGAIFGSS